MYNGYKCNNCDNISSEPFAYCSKCGQKAQKSCECGAIRVDNYKFCTRCGKAFESNVQQNNYNSGYSVPPQPPVQNYGNQSGGFVPPSSFNMQGGYGYNQPQNGQFSGGYLPEMARNNPYMDRYGAAPMPYGTSAPSAGYVPQPNRYVVTPVAEENVAQSVPIEPPITTEGYYNRENFTGAVQSENNEDKSTTAYDGSFADNMQVESKTETETENIFENGSSINTLGAEAVDNNTADNANGFTSSFFTPIPTAEVKSSADIAIEKRKKSDKRFLKIAFVGFWSLTAIAGVTVLIGFVLSAL